MNALMLGFAREDFTPDMPVRMNSQCTNDEVWHPIFATALYFCGEDQKVLVINLDIRELYSHFVNPLRPRLAQATGVKEENIILATTHNHSSPDCGASNEVANCIEWKERFGYPAILRAAVAAVADAKPVTKMEAGRVMTPKLSFVRRYQLEDGTWKGIATANTSESPRVRHESDADLEMRVVRMYREGGKDVILMNYQTHAAGALGKFPTKLNADFCGEMRDTVEEATGAYSVYLQGACGNTNYFTRLPEEKHLEKWDYREVGVILAKSVLEALENAAQLPLGKLTFRTENYMCDVNHSKDHLVPIALQIAEMEDPEAKKQAMRESGVNNRYELWGIIGRSRMPEQAPVELSSIGIGEFAMAFCPHEMFDILGKQLRDASPYAMTFPCNYAGIYQGYMPSAIMVPHGEYEVNMCRFVPGTGETELLRLLAQLRDMKM